jgi:hypothetical protein
MSRRQRHPLSRWFLIVLSFLLMSWGTYRMGYSRGEQDGAAKVLQSVFRHVHASNR